MKTIPKTTDARPGCLSRFVRALEFRPLFEDTPLLLGGYTRDETWVCTIDARQPDGMSGIHADFKVGPKGDFFTLHVVSVEDAKEWAQKAWQEIVGEWLDMAEDPLFAAMEDIEREASGALNNGFPEDAPDIVANLQARAARALRLCPSRAETADGLENYEPMSRHGGVVREDCPNIGHEPRAGESPSMPSAE